MPGIFVLISADAEWRTVRNIIENGIDRGVTPFGERFSFVMRSTNNTHQVTFIQCGWGKTSAAASTQYVIDHWKPDILVNLGTCGGFEGDIAPGEIILVERTIIYDIVEQMGDFDAHIAHYSTSLDMSWIKGKYPMPVRRELLVSGDRDLITEEIPILRKKYRAVAGDWESGAIAWVASKNGCRVLILRGVTDLVGAGGGEAYGNIEMYHQATDAIMRKLIHFLPEWLDLIQNNSMK